MYEVYEGYVRPAGSYAAVAWWPFLSKVHTDRLESCNYTAARIITGAPAGSIAAAIVLEAGLRPFAEISAQEAASQLLHFKRFDQGHKLHRLTLPPDTRPRQKARGGGLRGSWRSCAEATLEEAGIAATPIQPLPDPSDTPPPWALSDRVRFHETTGTTREPSPEDRRAAAERPLAALQAEWQPDAQVWSDGAAVDGIRDGGAGAVIRRRGQEDITISEAAGSRTSSTAAEATALAAGLRTLADLLQDTPCVVWCAFDSRALFDRLQQPWRADQDIGTTRAAKWIHRLSALHRILVIWVPGHAGLPLNEAADAAAKTGCTLDQEGIPITISAAKSILRNHLETRRILHYKEAVRADHVHRQVADGEPLPALRGVPRHIEVLLHQLRVGRGPFLQETKHRWGKVPSPTCTNCDSGAAEDVFHLFLTCPRWTAIRATTLGPSPSLRQVLHDEPSRAIDFLRGTGVAGPMRSDGARN